MCKQRPIQQRRMKRRKFKIPREENQKSDKRFAYPTERWVWCLQHCSNIWSSKRHTAVWHWRHQCVWRAAGDIVGVFVSRHGCSLFAIYTVTGHLDLTFSLDWACLLGVWCWPVDLVSISLVLGLVLCRLPCCLCILVSLSGLRLVFDYVFVLLV